MPHFTTPTLFFSVHEIPPVGQLYIYGAGGGGTHVYELLRIYRPEIEVLGFLDTYRDGECAGLSVRKSEFLVDDGSEIPLVLIASMYWQEIISQLQLQGIRRYAVIHPDILQKEIYFTEEEYQRYRPAIERTLELFQELEDRELYSSLIRHHRIATRDMTWFFYYHQRHLSDAPQYFHKVNTQAVETVIEGGVLDGWNTCQFLAMFPNLKSFVGFEPFHSEYLLGAYASLLAKDARVRVLPAALWHQDGRVRFHESVDGQSHVLNGDKEDGSPVEAVRLDSFVAQHNIMVDYIKLDVEGSELKILEGATATLRRHRPQLCVCLYHHKRDLFDIPLFLASILDRYTYHLGHHSHSFRETVLYAIPNELTSK